MSSKLMSGATPHESYMHLSAQTVGSTYFNLEKNFDQTTNDFTWEFWLRTTDISCSAGGLLRKSGAVGYQIHVTAGKLVFVLLGVTNATVTSAAAINDGFWHLCQCVCNRNNATSANRKLHIYIDGVLSASSVAINNTTSISVPASKLYLGYSATDMIKADISDIRLYSRALTAAECQDRYLNDTMISSDLVVQFPCNELLDDSHFYEHVSGLHEAHPVIAADVGYIRTAVPNAAGAGYVVGETFNITGGGTADVTAVGGSGEVTSVYITYGDTDQTTGTKATSGASGGGDNNLTLDVTVAAFGNANTSSMGWRTETNRRFSKTATLLGQIGFVTDIHHKTGIADRTPNLTAACEWFSKEMPAGSSFAILGDWISEVDAGTDQTSFDDLIAVIAGYDGGATKKLLVPIPVIGNHDTVNIDRVILLAYLEAGLGTTYDDGTHSYYSFDLGSLHIVVLDGDDDTNDPENPFVMTATQQAWLAADLTTNAAKSTLVLIHYRIEQDYPGNPSKLLSYSASGLYSAFCGSASDIRAILEAHSNVKWVVTGHEHGDHHVVQNGIRYFNIKQNGGTYGSEDAAAARNYAILRMYSDDTAELFGYGAIRSRPRR